MTATAETYARIFVGHGDGQAILEDLTARFHDRRIYVTGGLEGARETERRAAQSEVIRFILSQIGQVQRGETGEGDDANA